MNLAIHSLMNEHIIHKKLNDFRRRERGRGRGNDRWRGRGRGRGNRYDRGRGRGGQSRGNPRRRGDFRGRRFNRYRGRGYWRFGDGRDRDNGRYGDYPASEKSDRGRRRGRGRGRDRGRGRPYGSYNRWNRQNGGYRQDGIQYNYCKKYGHIKRDCKKRQNDEKRQKDRKIDLNAFEEIQVWNPEKEAFARSLIPKELPQKQKPAVGVIDLGYVGVIEPVIERAEGEPYIEFGDDYDNYNEFHYGYEEDYEDTEYEYDEYDEDEYCCCECDGCECCQHTIEEDEVIDDDCCCTCDCCAEELDNQVENEDAYGNDNNHTFGGPCENDAQDAHDDVKFSTDTSKSRNFQNFSFLIRQLLQHILRHQ